MEWKKDMKKSLVSFTLEKVKKEMEQNDVDHKWEGIGHGHHQPAGRWGAIKEGAGMGEESQESGEREESTSSLSHEATEGLYLKCGMEVVGDGSMITNSL
jgi:hypothetical protein